MTAVASALDVLVESAASDAVAQRARLDGRAWGLAAAGCTRAPELLEERTPAPQRLRAAGKLLRSHRAVLAAGDLPDPVLGEAEAPLAVRTAALAAWAAGVLDGLHAAALEALPGLDPTALEAYQDLAALAGAVAEGRPDEAGEAALATLVEHARVALGLLGAALAREESDAPG